MRAVILVIGICLSACGGETTNRRGATAGNIDVRVPSPLQLAVHASIPLEAGVLHLGAEDANSAEISFVIEAAKGQLTLFACDQVDAETAENGFSLAAVGYEDIGDAERIGGRAPRLLFRRLANEAAPRIQTCEEELELDERMVELLRAFLAARAPDTPEQFDTRAIALEGLELAMTISDRRPDVVRIEMMVSDPQLTLEECELHAMTGEDIFELDVDWDEGERQRGDADLTVHVPRRQMERLTSQNDVSFVVCGQSWPLDEMALETISSLVGEL